MSPRTPLHPLARTALAALGVSGTLVLGAGAPDAWAQATAPAAAASAPPRAASAPARTASAPARAASAPARAASAPAAPAPASGSAAQKVEITGTTQPDSQDERRRSTASRITFGREELDRMGDATLGEVLKRDRKSVV